MVKFCVCNKHVVATVILEHVTISGVSSKPSELEDEVNMMQVSNKSANTSVCTEPYNELHKGNPAEQRAQLSMTKCEKVEMPLKQLLPLYKISFCVETKEAFVPKWLFLE